MENLQDKEQGITGVYIFESYFKAMEKLPSFKKKWQLFEAVFRYGCYGEKIELDGIDTSSYFDIIAPIVDSGRTKRKTVAKKTKTGDAKEKCSAKGGDKGENNVNDFKMMVKSFQKTDVVVGVIEENTQPNLSENSAKTESKLSQNSAKTRRKLSENSTKTRSKLSKNSANLWQEKSECETEEHSINKEEESSVKCECEDSKQAEKLHTNIKTNIRTKTSVMTNTKSNIVLGGGKNLGDSSAVLGECAEGNKKTTEEKSNVVHNVAGGKTRNQTSSQNTKTPSIEEVRRFFEENKLSVDPEKFFYYYESRGWKWGKYKIEDWQSCVLSWKKTTPKRVADCRADKNTDLSKTRTRQNFENSFDGLGKVVSEF